MRKRVQIVLAAVFIAVLGVIALRVVRPSQPFEPVYQGKPLSQWLSELKRPATDDAAEIALAKMGTNAVPFLLHWLQATESPTQTRFWLFMRRHSLIKADWNTAGDRADEAVIGIGALGRKAADLAIPQIIGLFNSPDLIYGGNNSAYQAARALAKIGAPAIEPLLQVLTNQDATVRYHACFALGWFPSLRTNAAVPPLVARLQDTNQYVRTRAAIALGDLHQEPGLAVPALSRTLGDSASVVRRAAALALVEFGSQATPALPSLLKAFQQERTINSDLTGRSIIDNCSAEDMRTIISNAVTRIDPTVNVAAPNALNQTARDTAGQAGAK